MNEWTRFARYLGTLLLVLVLTGCLSNDSNNPAGPQVSFTNYGGAAQIQTPDIVVSIAGTATSNVEIESVEWTNDRGGRGSANGKENWVTGNIVLKLGTNNITVTATDSAGAAKSKSIAVEREATASAATVTSETPEALYSYSNNLAAAAPVEGARIKPGPIFFLFSPTADMDAREISHIEYSCCKGISGPGAGSPFGSGLNVSFRPWSIAVDLSGMEPGGIRRLRTTIHFKDGSTPEAHVFDFEVAGSGSTNRAPKISGNPPNVATAGVAYNFRPTATDADGDSLSFNISNKPSWASFDRKTGILKGTPSNSHFGVFKNITISVSDGQSTTQLPGFSITVTPVSNGTATLTWDAPTQRTDNTVLTDLAGYEIHFGQSPRSYSNRITVKNPGITTYMVDNLSSGTWYFAVSAFDSSGQKSNVSGEGQKTVK